MRSISASIIVLAAAILLLGGYYMRELYILVVGYGVGLIGLIGWYVSMKEK